MVGVPLDVELGDLGVRLQDRGDLIEQAERPGQDHGVAGLEVDPIERRDLARLEHGQGRLLAPACSATPGSSGQVSSAWAPPSPSQSGGGGGAAATGSGLATSGQP